MCRVFTCTGAEREAHPLLGAVENHVEALHDGGSDDEAVGRRRHAESEAVQRAVDVCDWLNVQLGEGQAEARM